MNESIEKMTVESTREDLLTLAARQLTKAQDGAAVALNFLMGLSNAIERGEVTLPPNALEQLTGVLTAAGSAVSSTQDARLALRSLGYTFTCGPVSPDTLLRYASPAGSAAANAYLAALLQAMAAANHLDEVLGMVDPDAGPIGHAESVALLVARLEMDRESPSGSGLE